MIPLAIPESGLTLVDSVQSQTENGPLKADNKPIQIMQLELTDDVLQEVLRSARHGGKGVNMSFGKMIVCISRSTDKRSPADTSFQTLHFGNKSQPFVASTSSSHSRLYDYSSENENELAFAGRISHKLALQKAQEDIAGADEALAKLQSQLASHEKDKQSKQ